ncbi:zinc transporter ZIP13 homolog [Calliphora vicina]|uniref:zinc transporter ZIP13 homolog n=1 Tax=Calliphora vicina TaxID=7373 RepID=UPI00325C2A59
MNSTAGFFYDHIVMLYTHLVNQCVPEYFKDFEYTPWVFSLLGSVVIGLSGILPLLIIPTDEKLNKQGYKDPGESKFLRVLLSFAVGGLLGDVFLHLLPEAWKGDNEKSTSSGDYTLNSGLWVLSGILIFTIVEKIFSGYTNADEDQPKKVTGYLNLVANSIDNFTHGLAVAGPFLVSFRHGVFATFAILLHEIPHEVGDFAILLRSGFSRSDAAWDQLLTASAGLLGALVAIGGSGITSAMEARTSWIMPFTAGGFLHIALVTVLPDLLQENNRLESIKQFLALIAGIAVMAVMTILFEH